MIKARGRSLLTAVALGALSACDMGGHVNGSINLAAGQSAGNLATVNGSIQLGPGASAGSVRAVNGTLTLGEGARVQSLNTVNGSIRIANNARVSAEVRTVNGSIQAAGNARVGGAVENINGSVTIDGAHVGGRVRTVNGAVTITNGARVDGDLLIEKAHGLWNWGSAKAPRVVIGPEAAVSGTLRFERAVRLYVSDRVKQLGPIAGATPITFSGDTPPD